MSAEAALAPCRFLVVDDDADIRRIEMRVLEQKGFDCVGVASADEAIGVLARGDVDVLLTDIRMPGTDGLSLARHAHQEHPGVVVIMVTACDDPGSASDARLAGAADYLVKPFANEQLVAAAARAVHVKSRRRGRAPVKRAAPAKVQRPGAVTAELDQCLAQMLDLRASDLHLSPGHPVLARVDGDMISLDPDGALLRAPDVERMLWPILPADGMARLHDRHDMDFSFEWAGRSRFRCNAFRSHGGIAASIRAIPTVIPTAAQLDFPDVLLDLCGIRHGLVLVTGPTGSGKSTTVAAMVDTINSQCAGHIITIEDPIEFVHASRKALVSQREVGTHAPSFDGALRSALREDPDVIVVGELRDLETTAMALRAAETGHLVIATLHSQGAVGAIDRIIDQFPAGQQPQIRTMLADTLRGVVAQTLCRRVGGGRVAAREILVTTPAVANLIRSGRGFQINTLMQVGRDRGMVSLNHALGELARQGVIPPSEAASHGLSVTRG